MEKQMNAHLVAIMGTKKKAVIKSGYVLHARIQVNLLQ